MLHIEKHLKKNTEDRTNNNGGRKKKTLSVNKNHIRIQLCINKNIRAKVPFSCTYFILYILTSHIMTSSCYFSIFSVVIIKLYVSSFRCRCCVQFRSNFYTLSYNRCSHTLILFFTYCARYVLSFLYLNKYGVCERANGIYYIYKRQNGGFCRFCFSIFFFLLFRGRCNILH